MPRRHLREGFPAGPVRGSGATIVTRGATVNLEGWRMFGRREAVRPVGENPA